MIKYSDYFMDTLKELGYTTCFYVGGGNCMHLLESASRYFDCIPVVHEVSSAIASEYFNQGREENERAFALVTAGPGFTNLVTGIAGAWLDSRELLVVGGQAKSSNLAKGTVRQIGHQEVDGVSVARSITKVAVTLEVPMSSEELSELVKQSWLGRPGPVFIEVCLDVSAMSYSPPVILEKVADLEDEGLHELFDAVEAVLEKLRTSRRPLFLLGGGVSRNVARSIQVAFASAGIPICCTWTGGDRVNPDYPFYAGRPNTYGMRWANIFLQQADLVVAVGSSLGFQQTGFNTDEFLPVAEFVQIDIDAFELEKVAPKLRETFRCDSSNFLLDIAAKIESEVLDTREWLDFLSELKALVPTLEECQKADPPYLSPHQVVDYVSQISAPSDRIVGTSSGGTMTASMQLYHTKGVQILLTNKGLASMGYGLAGAIGLAVQNRSERVILFEGDGGFAQNLQELGTVAANHLNVKIFLTSNDGYASIRTSQKNYFQGHYLGCDASTGLGLPNWEKLFESFGIETLVLTPENLKTVTFHDAFASVRPFAFLIQADPEQMYLPKIFSRIAADGSMQSTALHDMSPALPSDVAASVFRYLPKQYVPSSG